MNIDNIKPPPDGKNQITRSRNSDIEKNDVITFISGEEDMAFPLVSNLLVNEYPEGERVTISKKKVKELEDWYKGRISGYHMSLVMTCAEQCPYIKQCPIKRMGIDIPEGHPCAWESGLFKARVAGLCAELNVDPQDKNQYVDYNTIREISSVEMLLERVSMEISTKPRSVIPQAVGIDGDGHAIFQDMINKRYEWLNQLTRKKVGLLESLSATRRERIKAGVATGQDPASYVTDLMNRKMRLIDMRVGDETITTRDHPEIPEPDDDGMISFEIDEDELGA